MARTITGVVTSDKADKTIVVTVTSRRTHPLYRKQYTIHSKFMAHDEKNEAVIGDKVVISESRPLSARKRFILSEIIERPKLREDSLAAAKSEDTGKKPTRVKKEDEAEEPAKEAKPAKQPKSDKKTEETKE
jgi:small subunit ribosomal protein S17